MGTLSGEAIQSVIFIFASLLLEKRENFDQLFKKRIWSPMSKFSPSLRLGLNLLIGDQFWKGFVVQRSKLEVTKVVPLFGKNGENHESTHTP